MHSKRMYTYFELAVVAEASAQSGNPLSDTTPIVYLTCDYEKLSYGHSQRMLKLTTNGIYVRIVQIISLYALRTLEKDRFFVPLYFSFVVSVLVANLRQIEYTAHRSGQRIWSHDEMGPLCPNLDSNRLLHTHGQIHVSTGGTLLQVIPVIFSHQYS